MGKAPRECGVRAAKVSQVAFHPRTLVVAVGYEDGFILLCRLSDAAEILVREPQPGDGARQRARLGRHRRAIGLRPDERRRRRPDPSRLNLRDAIIPREYVP